MDGTLRDLIEMIKDNGERDHKAVSEQLAKIDQGVDEIKETVATHTTRLTVLERDNRAARWFFGVLLVSGLGGLISYLVK